MGLSKEQRIGILLVIDGLFFILELTTGYAVHSLALVADAFHMLNDVLSLCVGLWAVRVAKQGNSKMYTYGWQRAETLGALVNGVFLVALCLSIFLEAITRFVEVQIVSNPQLVLIVGCLGLASNILGLVLFHDHGHGGDHGHSHGDPTKEAEEGHGHSHAEHTHTSHEEHDHEHSHSETSPLLGRKESKTVKSKTTYTRSDEDDTTLSSSSSHAHQKRKSVGSQSVQTSHRRKASVDDIPVHPASMRQSWMQQAQVDELSEPDSEEALDDSEESHHHQHGSNSITKVSSPKFSHSGHNHTQPRQPESGGGGHGHSHGDLNMRGVFLHVLGDALGNIGVIATALIIWLTDWSFRYYFDPAISLVITCIILASAIPLCKAASRILLQAVPMGLSIDEIRQDIEGLDGVEQAHHVHVWQLSDTKLVASLHVRVDCEVKGAGSARYMALAREIQTCLHGYGIHSSTIQPEFTQALSSSTVESSHSSSSNTNGHSHTAVDTSGSKAASLGSAKDQSCMLDCDEDCEPKGQCCPPISQDSSGQGQK